MSNQPYLYDPQANVLRQKRDPNRSFGRADHWNTESEAEHNAAEKAWREYMDSLPAYTPISGWVPEVGREYYEGKDFELSFGTEIAIPTEQKQECNHEPMVDTGVGYYRCPACDWNCTYQEYEAGQPSKKERSFTLADMIECWEAAINMPSGEYWKKKYFSSKGIDLP